MQLGLGKAISAITFPRIESIAPLAVGVAGTGPWARGVHAPTFAAGPDTRLTAVWSRTEAAATSLAGQYDVAACTDFDDLLARCNAVVLAVPPSAQPELAARAAEAGKAILLEKPLAENVDDAARVVELIERAAVPNLMMLTYRFVDGVRDFLERAASFDAIGGRGCFLSGAFLGPTYGHGWRVAHGALLDVGPHILDLADAALGRVTSVQAHGDTQSWIGVLLEHEGGVTSEISISCVAAITPSRTEMEIFGKEGQLFADGRVGEREDVWANMRADFVAVARGEQTNHPCDARRGLHVQHLVHAAAIALAEHRPVALPAPTTQ